MTDPRRRLHVVTEAAYASQGPAAAGMPGPDAGGREAGGTEAGGREPEGGPGEEPGPDAPLERHPPGSKDWTAPAGLTRGNRWGTPVLLAVRLGVVVLVLAVAATVTIVLTRPSAPAHQPELAWPEPPEDWDAVPEAVGSEEGPDGSHVGDLADGTKESAADLAQEPSEGQSDQEAGPDLLVVHVAGAVHTPSIVELPEEARVHEAITAAGGATEDADLAALNLAASVQDGQQVYVPAVGEEPRPNAPDGGAPDDGAPDGAAPDPAVSAGGGSAVVDLNSATAAELQTLPGIGPAMAERILTHRDEHGPFSSVDDLLAVSGIGPATMERLRDLVTV